MNRSSSCIALFGALALSACGGGSAPAEPLAMMTLTPTSPAMKPGSTVQLTATGASFNVKLDMTATARWTSSSPEIASVDHGLVTGLQEGTALITASGRGVKTEVTVIVRHALVAFLTPVKGTGNLSTWPGAGGKTGLVAADAICQTSADSAGLPGTFRAWLSDSHDDAACRAAGFSGKATYMACDGDTSKVPTAGPWVRVDGFPFVTSIKSLSRYDVYVPIRLDAYGKEVGNDTSWNSTLEGGTVFDDLATCQDWTSTADDPKGVYFPREILSLATRTDYLSLHCADTARLICLEIGPSVPAPIPPAHAKLAFVSSVTGNGKLSTWPDAGGKDGLAGADAVCQARAAAAGLANASRFKALLSDGAISLSDRLTSDGPWARTDGVPLAESREALFAHPLFTTLDVTETGERAAEDNYHAWTGVDPKLTPSAYTCSGWTDVSGNRMGSTGPVTSVTRWWSWLTTGCESNFPLYCFED